MRTFQEALSAEYRFEAQWVKNPFDGKFCDFYGCGAMGYAMLVKPDAGVYHSFTVCQKCFEQMISHLALNSKPELVEAEKFQIEIDGQILDGYVLGGHYIVEVHKAKETDIEEISKWLKTVGLDGIVVGVSRKNSLKVYRVETRRDT